MKKLILVLFYLGLTFSVSAQWGYGGYGSYSSPNVMMDPCVQAAMATAASTASVNQNCMQMQQAMMQMQQAAIANGWNYQAPMPSPPSYNNSSSSTSSHKRSSRTCGLCGGSGQITTTKGVASFGNKKWCSKCNKHVPANHYHTTCPSCKGKGSW
ncbi:MAG: hypothetical protein E7148_07510 [Rikenellaceae bacterium]|nr:hypothetical protein [Rikenellaceae bacterium]